jgi:N-acetylmuramoyl-L-alanine amidase
MKGWLIGFLCVAALYHSGPGRACSPADFVVAIDVGHSLKSPGAVSARGVGEFQFNRELAKVVVDALSVAGFHNSFLINGDGHISNLGQRVTEAGRRQADLFLSIHHDSVQPRYLSNWTLDGVIRRYSDRFSGFSLFVSARNARFDDSRSFAASIGRALTAQALTPTLHHAEPIEGESRLLLDASLGLYRYDDLVVLKGAAMPAVLLEAGVILNRDEELLLVEPAYRNRIGAAIVSAVRDFCDEPARGSGPQR